MLHQPFSRRPIANWNDLREYLAGERLDQVAFSFLKHLASYAIGRSLSFKEIEFLKQKCVELKGDQFRMREMVRLIVKSDMFLEK